MIQKDDASQPVSPPLVQLVGAGPGRADLITVRGLAAVRQAEVVLYDRLIPRALLAEAAESAELIFVGKRPGHHPQPQPVINALLLDYARAGKRVVRLKGGDPFVFGRGGEEALALAEAGIGCEVVPGITSAVAVPGFAGIPVTQKGMGASFTVLTGYEDPTKPASMNDWRALAQRPTLVILMAVKQLPAIAANLMAAGRAAETAAAAISKGTTDQQRTVCGTLATLPALVEAAELPTPALIVIGAVAGLAAALDWFTADGGAAGFVQGGDDFGERGREGAKASLRARVQLVGAGPGAADLITVRGLAALRAADVVVHDRLVNPALVAEARADAEVINVGKGPMKGRFPQAEINRILAAQAQAGKRVVRLKGGDPFVFGLGGDECLALREAGIAYEVVPGVTSATAVPALAGIPVTHRGVATSFTVISGHLAPGEADAAEWEHLPPFGTLVILMGVDKLPQIVDHLRANGQADGTPVAVISSGTTAAQATIVGTLADIVERAAGVRPPSLVVVGEVVALREQVGVVERAGEDTAVWGVARSVDD